MLVIWWFANRWNTDSTDHTETTPINKQRRRSFVAQMEQIRVVTVRSV